METATTTLDIQQRRTSERLANALEAAPASKKQIAEQLRAWSEAQALTRARAAATADLADLRQLKAAADNVDAEARSQIIRLLAGNRAGAGDPFARTNALRALDDLCRLKAIAPILPELIAEKEASIKRLDEQVKGNASPGDHPAPHLELGADHPLVLGGTAAR